MASASPAIELDKGQQRRSPGHRLNYGSLVVEIWISREERIGGVWQSRATGCQQL